MTIPPYYKKLSRKNHNIVSLRVRLNNCTEPHLPHDQNHNTIRDFTSSAAFKPIASSLSQFVSFYVSSLSFLYFDQPNIHMKLIRIFDGNSLDVAATFLIFCVRIFFLIVMILVFILLLLNIWRNQVIKLKWLMISP
jgi:hypothetical protein